MKRLFFIIGLVLVAGTLFWLARGEQQPAAPAGEQVVVRRGTIVATISATGRVEAARQVPLSFRTAAPIAEILVGEGEQVEEEAPLIRLESTELAAAVEQAEAALAAQQAQLRQLESPPRASELAAAETALASARANLARLQSGADQEEVRAARAQLEAAQATLARLEAGPEENALIAARAELEQAEASLRQAQAAYDQVSHLPNVGALPQSLQLEQATIAHEAARANYEAIAAGPTTDQIEQARANVVQAQSNLNRLLGGTDRAELAAAEAQVARATADLERLQSGPDENELDALRAAVRQAEIALDQARRQLQEADLLAPFAGTVGQISTSEGEIPVAMQPVITLVDLSSLYVEAEVDEIDVPALRAGDPVTVTIDALPDTPLPGRIDQIAPLPNVAQGVVTYPIRVALEPETMPELRVGMSARIDIIIETREDVLLVPNHAIEIDRATGTLSVERLEGEEPSRTTIRLGLRGERESEVVEGLDAGDILLIRESERENLLP